MCRTDCGEALGVDLASAGGCSLRSALLDCSGLVVGDCDTGFTVCDAKYIALGLAEAAADDEDKDVEASLFVAPIATCYPVLSACG